MVVLQIMELVYVILEAGYTIKELIVINNKVEIEIYIYIDTVKISTRLTYSVKDNECIYTMLDEMKLISRSDIEKYRNMFVNSNNNNNTYQSRYHLSDTDENIMTGNTKGDQVVNDNIGNSGIKNIAIMKFVLGAMSSGWKVRKSTGKRQYTFNKTHHHNKKYFNGSFLSKFLKKNALR
jgi:hypothetical protein